MPSTIPYDPTLVLANVVDQGRIDNVIGISRLRAITDAAQAELNSHLHSKRSLDATRTELQNLGIKVDNLTKAMGTLDVDIENAAVNLATQKIKVERQVQALSKNVNRVNANIESPVDYNKTEIKSLPLASNSIDLDVQYFNREENDENAQSFASTIGNYVSARTSGWLGPSGSSQMSTNAQKQVSKQLQNHSITGTLVISISCTHKKASILAPLVINPDKGIKVWNRLFKDDPLNPSDLNAMTALAEEASTRTGNERSFSLVSGMTYGSSFVGMVHILNTTKTRAEQKMSSLATSVQATVQKNLWIRGASGSFGLNGSVTRQVQDLFSAQNVTSHVTLLCMGVIPSIAANDLKLGVKQFADMSPAANMEAIAKIQGSTVGDQESTQKAAEAARTGQQMISLQTAKIESALSALKDTDERSNKILDINSMMAALDDFVAKAAEGEGGVPLNVYLKDVTKIDLAELWIAKYYPQKVQIRVDDSERADAPDA